MLCSLHLLSFGDFFPTVVCMPVEIAILILKKNAVGVGLGELPMWVTSGQFKGLFEVDQIHAIIDYFKTRSQQTYFIRPNASSLIAIIGSLCMSVAVFTVAKLCNAHESRFCSQEITPTLH